MHVMLDIETLGTAPGSVIFAIGAVKFDADRVHEADGFYRLIAPVKAQADGFLTDAATQSWWDKQTEASRRELKNAHLAGSDMPTALRAFAAWMPKDAKVWGKGPSFDNALVTAAFHKVRLPVPWKFWNDRCVRTMYALYPEQVEHEPVLAHHALHDAIAQARNVSDMLRGHHARRP